MNNKGRIATIQVSNSFPIRISGRSITRFTALFLVAWVLNLVLRPPVNSPAIKEAAENEQVFTNYICQTEPFLPKQGLASFPLPSGFQIERYAAELKG